MRGIEFIHEEIVTLFHSEKFYGRMDGNVIIATRSRSRSLRDVR